MGGRMGLAFSRPSDDPFSEIRDHLIANAKMAFFPATEGRNTAIFFSREAIGFGSREPGRSDGGT